MADYYVFIECLDHLTNSVVSSPLLYDEGNIVDVLLLKHTEEITVFDRGHVSYYIYTVSQKNWTLFYLSVTFADTVQF